MTITVNDGETTPVAHTFNVARTATDSAEFLNSDGGVPRAYERLVFRLKRPNLNAQNPGNYYTASVRLEMPVLEAIPTDAVNSQGYAPAQKMAYVNSGEVTIRSHHRSLSQERVNARTLLKNLLVQADTVSFFDDLVSVPTS